MNDPQTTEKHANVQHELPCHGVRVAEVRYSGRPDGSTSECVARAIEGLPELADAAEALLHEVGFGRIIFDTPASERLWAALSSVRGMRVTPKPREW
jgi:sugar phosphate isomerase/epimerase